jgi:TIR domain
MPRNIFISYRREENKYQARMIFDAFQNAKVNVFYDVDSIPLGRDFRETIMVQVQKCDVLLALVGRNWAQWLDPKTKLPRLENADDFVRIEIGTALNRGIPVVPVLLDDAPLPETDQLPNDLRNLFDRQAEFISFRTFDDDVKRPITKLAIKSRQEQEPSELTTTVQAGEPPLGDRAAGYNFMGREIPLPSFETLTKASGWVQRQATIWFSIVKDPKEFIAGTDINSPKALGDSIQFLFVICVCITLLGVPLNIFLGHTTIFNPTYYVSSIVLLLVRVLLFTMVVHFSAKVMGGKGSVSRTTTSMFYAAAFLPMILLLNYSAIIDPAAKEIAFLAIALPAIAYVVTKLVSVVKFIFSVGTIRALIAVGAGVATVLLPL